MTDDVPDQFGDEHASGGPFYELNIVLGPLDDEVLKTATPVLLSAARIEGFWQNVYTQPERIEDDAWTLEDITDGSHLHSLVELPSGHWLNCGVLAHRDGLSQDGGDDWLVLYIPLFALKHVGDERLLAFDHGEDETSLVWRRPIDDWMAHVALEVRRTVSFKLASIGLEMHGREDYLSTDPQQGRFWACVLADGTYLPATC